MTSPSNPWLTLPYQPVLEQLGSEFYEQVTAAEFPQHRLRFRNDRLLPLLGLTAEAITDAQWLAALGQFEERVPLLALAYHGYQFGEYNPRLGDGRGFLYGQVRGIDGELYDLGTKGSGTTPFSRTADGRLTLKGGVREVLAAEMLERLGIKTSRCLSLIETGETLWRGDEPSPTRSAVMVRLSRSHIRFGTFERLHYLGRPDLVQQLLDHVLSVYYPHLWDQADRYARFYAELVTRVAQLVAQWLAAGFCHGVLNTDNMSITGESFDYGPYAFITTYDPKFTAAYFDYFGRYSYGNQPALCRWNLEMLQHPLAAVISAQDMAEGLALFEDTYYLTYHQAMLHKLGFSQTYRAEADDLLKCTILLLTESQVSYYEFFQALRTNFSEQWLKDSTLILASRENLEISLDLLTPWQQAYSQLLKTHSSAEITQIPDTLQRYNASVNLIRPQIEAVWEPISYADDWLPLYNLIDAIREI